MCCETMCMKCADCIMIINCQIYFVVYIFVVYASYENIFNDKNFQIYGLIMQSSLKCQQNMANIVLEHT